MVCGSRRGSRAEDSLILNRDSGGRRNSSLLLYRHLVQTDVKEALMLNFFWDTDRDSHLVNALQMFNYTYLCSKVHRMKEQLFFGAPLL